MLLLLKMNKIISSMFSQCFIFTFRSFFIILFYYFFFLISDAEICLISRGNVVVPTGFSSQW